MHQSNLHLDQTAGFEPRRLRLSKPLISKDLQTDQTAPVDKHAQNMKNHVLGTLRYCRITKQIDTQGGFQILSSYYLQKSVSSAVNNKLLRLRAVS